MAVAAALAIIGAARASEPTEQGKRIYRMDCSGCHKWDGHGWGGYGGAALSLRETQLNREQIITTVECGRPGTGMPYHLRDAYMAEHPCYGLTSRDSLGKEAPLEANNFLRLPDIEAVVDYVLANIKGRGEPTFAECQAFFDTSSRVCDDLRKPAG